MVDWYTEQLFDYECDKVVFPYSRLLCDVERYLDPKKEIMTSKGMWIDYSLTHDGQPLKVEHDSTEVIEKIYKPHHQATTQLVSNKLQQFGNCLIVDCHSFSSIPLPYELQQDTQRPDICLGTDVLHTPDWLIQGVKGLFETCGYSVGLNAPYSGCYVPLAHSKNANVCGIMIEVNRKNYMNELNGKKLSRFAKVCEDIQKILSWLQKEGKYD